MEWNSLKASDKSRIIRTAVEHGITDLEEVKSLWRQSVEQPEMYDGGGILYDNGTQSPDNPPMGRANPDNWREYMDWAYAASERLSKEWDEPESFIFFDMLNSNDYDYKAFYDEDPERAWQWLESPEGSHFDDVGKTVYHPSFSDESMYSANNYGDMGTGANPDNITGPAWNDNNQLIDKEGNVVFDENTYAEGGIMDGPDDPPSVKVDYKYHFDRATDSNTYPKQFEYNENAPDIPDNPYVDYDLLWKNNTSIGNNRKMNRTNMEQVDNYLVQKGVPLYQRQAILYTILQESGGDSLGAHGNGYYGLVGWSPERYNMIKDKSLIGQTEYLYNTLYNGNGDSDWGHGGTGTGYKSWTDAKNAFINADNVNTAIWALTHGYIRPAADVRKYRIENGPKHFSRGGLKESYKNMKLFKIN